MSPDVALGEDHPLVLEFASLREAVNHFQGEAHRATVQLRHQSLEHSTLLQHLHALENENSFLRNELQIHRAAGPAGTHRDTLQVQELTLALRRLSDKLDLTEKVLLERNLELITARSERVSTKKAEEHAVEAVQRLRSDLAASFGRERELTNRVKTSEEQRKMSDLVVEEYASLVRSLEGRPSLSSRTNGKDTEGRTRNSLDGLTHARQGLHKLLQDSNHDSEKLHAELNRLHEVLDSTRTELEIERATAQEDRQRLAQAQLELHQLKCDDNAAAKMVSRYMRFSQSSTDVLHGAIEKLKVRQDAIVTSYEARLQQAEERIASEMRQSEMLRRALDELAEDISRESYGRRREIVLRLELLAREERLSESLRRWLHKAHEIFQKARSAEDGKYPYAAFERILGDARDILASIDTSVLVDEPASPAERLYAAYATVKALRTELQRETDKRLYFEYQLASSQRVPTNASSTKMPNVIAAQRSIPGTLASLKSPLDSSGAPSPSITSTDEQHNHSPSASQVTSSHLNNPDDLEPVPIPSSGITTSSAEVNPALDSHRSPSVTMNGDHDNSTPQEYRDVSPPATSLPESDGCDVLKGAPLNTSVIVTSDQVDSGDLAGTTQSAVGTCEDDAEIVSSIEESEAAELSPAISLTGPNSEHISMESPGTGKDSIEKLSTESLEGSRLKLPAEDDIEDSHLYGPASQMLPMPESERHKDSFPSPKLGGSNSQDVIESSEANSKDLAPLLSRLIDVDDRYTDLQRSFRDCHLALQELRQTSRDDPNSKILHVAVERLSDYCEDARVELEIRIADEERIAKGFQTLLSVPGALSEEVNEQEIMQQIEAFVDGSDPAVRRAQDLLKHKLDDLEHDIAAVKRALYSPPSPMLSPEDIREQSKAPSSSGWSSWTGSLLGSTRTSSPAPSFGAVMTSPRLRHSSSTRSLRAESSDAQSPIAGLGLRIPMPNTVQHQSGHPPPTIMQRGSARPHVTSAVFSLGLRGGFPQGMSRPSLALNHSDANARPEFSNNEGGLDSDID